MKACQFRLVMETLESRELLSAEGLAVGHLPHRFRGVTSMSVETGAVPGEETTYSATRSRFLHDRAGSTMSSAADLGLIASDHVLDGRVGLGDQTDVFRFEIDQRSEFALNLQSSFGNTDLALYNHRGQLVASSADNYRFERLSATIESGTYYAEVSAARSWFARYTLSFAVRRDSGWTQPSPTPPSRSLPSRPPVVGKPVANPPASAPPQVSPNRPTSPVTPNPPNVPVTPAPPPIVDVPYFGGANEWNLNTVNAPEAWAAGATGVGVVVAVVDTGVDWTHSDLAANIWTNSDELAGDGVDNDGNGFIDDVRGWNFADGNSNVSDTQGHGTHVAGTVAAVSNGFGATGVAHDATIMPVRVLADNGSGSSSDVAAGIRYAVQNGADIINLSLGGGFSYAIQSALQYALSNNVLVVAASGNESASTASYPAAHSATLSNVISVGAHDRSGNRARFSNLPGSGVVQVDAPGVGIYSTLVGNRYGYKSGTSMAAPHVAGLAALALSRHPDLSVTALRSKLATGATRSIGGSPNTGVNATTTLAASAITIGPLTSRLGERVVLNFDDQEESVDLVMALIASERQAVDGSKSVAFPTGAEKSRVFRSKLGLDRVEEPQSNDLVHERLQDCLLS